MHHAANKTSRQKSRHGTETRPNTTMLQSSTQTSTTNRQGRLSLNLSVQLQQKHGMIFVQITITVSSRRNTWTLFRHLRYLQKVFCRLLPDLSRNACRARVSERKLLGRNTAENKTHIARDTSTIRRRSIAIATNCLYKADLSSLSFLANRLFPP